MRPEKQPPQKEICKKLVDRLVSRRTFEPFDKPSVGCRFIRFRIRGESVTGQLGFPIANFQQCTSYPLRLDNGELVEIVGSRLLHKQIREGDLCGRRVKVIYQGRDFTHAGHHRKIYRVFQIGYDSIPQKMWNKIIAEAKGNKNG